MKTPLCLSYPDINEAYTELHLVKQQFTEWEDTRNGRALVFNCPVIVTFSSPYRRVLFDPVRDANPFFHYMEAIWMLSGQQAVHFPSLFASNIKNYSDDGVVLHGAYGHRWRYHFDVDQVNEIIELLKKEPSSRRAVLTMWDPTHDLGVDSKDLPCNTHIYFRISQGDLHMTVCNRSNDMVWGMLGANVVHMSILQEFIAHTLSLNVGNYYQFTNNLHVYADWVLAFSHAHSRWYQNHPSFKKWWFSELTFDSEEAQYFIEDMGEGIYKTRILRDNALPMLRAWQEHKHGDDDLALHWASKIYDEDWSAACQQWIQRRIDAKQEKVG